MANGDDPGGRSSAPAIIPTVGNQLGIGSTDRKWEAILTESSFKDGAPAPFRRIGVTTAYRHQTGRSAIGNEKCRHLGRNRGHATAKPGIAKMAAQTSRRICRKSSLRKTRLVGFGCCCRIKPNVLRFPIPDGDGLAAPRVSLETTNSAR
jgi:hypothetical protein